MLVRQAIHALLHIHAYATEGQRPATFREGVRQRPREQAETVGPRHIPADLSGATRQPVNPLTTGDRLQLALTPILQTQAPLLTQIAPLTTGVYEKEDR